MKAGSPLTAWQTPQKDIVRRVPVDEPEADADTTPQPIVRPYATASSLTPTRKSPAVGASGGLRRQPTMAEEIREKASKIGFSPHHRQIGRAHV